MTTQRFKLESAPFLTVTDKLPVKY